MKIKKSWLNILIYISLAFVVYTLINKNYLVIPVIYSLTNLCISFIFLFISFFYQIKIWQKILEPEMPIKLSEATTSTGLSIFAKYIPGKIMVVVGRVAFISAIYPHYSRSKLISRSLDTQIITLWLGLIIGSVPFFLIDSFSNYRVYFILLLIAFSLFIFTPAIHNIFKKVVLLIFHREINLPRLNFEQTIEALFPFIIFWLTLSIAFYFFIITLSAQSVSIWSGLSFVLASTFGIILLIAPGGIGVREGILVILLTFYGLDIKSATSISVASRLWFLIGEAFTFILAILTKRVYKNEN